MVVGLVKLPGMMSGQIIGGQEPLNAAKYQMVVMFMLVAGDALAATLTVQLALRNFFTPAAQLRPLVANGAEG
jgi:putative ABC transport system permease protein